MLRAQPGFRICLSAALLLLAASSAFGGNQLFQSNFGAAFSGTDKPCPANELPPFEIVVPIPNIFDPNDLDEALFSCFVFTDRKQKPAKNVKGTYQTHLRLLDNLTGEFEDIPIGSGRFKTDSEGFDSFDFEIPSELFADGFESGDVSAWSYTRSDFTNKKKVDGAAVQCGKGASR